MEEDEEDMNFVTPKNHKRKHTYIISDDDESEPHVSAPGAPCKASQRQRRRSYAEASTARRKLDFQNVSEDDADATPGLTGTDREVGEAARAHQEGNDGDGEGDDGNGRDDSGGGAEEGPVGEGKGIHKYDLWCASCARFFNKDSFSAKEQKDPKFGPEQRFCLKHTAGDQTNYVRQLEARAARALAAPDAVPNDVMVAMGAAAHGIDNEGSPPHPRGPGGARDLGHPSGWMPRPLRRRSGRGQEEEEEESEDEEEEVEVLGTGGKGEGDDVGSEAGQSAELDTWDEREEVAEHRRRPHEDGEEEEEDVMEWREGMNTMPFGRYKGSPLTDVREEDPGYLRELCRKFRVFIHAVEGLENQGGPSGTISRGLSAENSRGPSAGNKGGPLGTDKGGTSGSYKGDPSAAYNRGGPSAGEAGPSAGVKGGPPAAAEDIGSMRGMEGEPAGLRDDGRGAAQGKGRGVTWQSAAQGPLEEVQEGRLVAGVGCHPAVGVSVSTASCYGKDEGASSWVEAGPAVSGILRVNNDFVASSSAVASAAGGGGHNGGAPLAHPVNGGGSMDHPAEQEGVPRDPPVAVKREAGPSLLRAGMPGAVPSSSGLHTKPQGAAGAGPQWAGPSSSHPQGTPVAASYPAGVPAGYRSELDGHDTQGGVPSLFDTPAKPAVALSRPGDGVCGADGMYSERDGVQGTPQGRESAVQGTSQGVGRSPCADQPRTPEGATPSRAGGWISYTWRSFEGKGEHPLEGKGGQAASEHGSPMTAGAGRGGGVPGTPRGFPTPGVGAGAFAVTPRSMMTSPAMTPPSMMTSPAMTPPAMTPPSMMTQPAMMTQVEGTPPAMTPPALRRTPISQPTTPVHYPGGDVPVGFGKNCNMTYQQVLHEKPSYCAWVVQEAASSKQCGPGLAKLADWLRDKVGPKGKPRGLRFGDLPAHDSIAGGSQAG